VAEAHRPDAVAHDIPLKPARHAPYVHRALAARTAGRGPRVHGRVT